MSSYGRFLIFMLCNIFINICGFEKNYYFSAVKIKPTTTN